MSTSNKMNSMQSDIASAIKQSAEAAGVGLTSMLGGSEADAETRLRNVVSTTISTENLTKSMSIIMQRQTVIAANSGIQIGRDINIKQGATVFAAAVVQEINNNEVINRLKTAIDQKSEATTTNPLDFLANLAGAVLSPITGLTNMWSLFLMVILVAFGYWIFFSGSSNNRVESVAVNRPTINSGPLPQIGTNTTAVSNVSTTAATVGTTATNTLNTATNAATNVGNFATNTALNTAGTLQGVRPRSSVGTTPPRPLGRV
jgi:hypothetical protein